MPKSLDTPQMGVTLCNRAARITAAMRLEGGIAGGAMTTDQGGGGILIEAHEY